MKPLTVFSAFDGAGIGLLALKRVGIPAAAYYASEVDKYAIKIAKKNHPEIIHVGDVKQCWARNFPFHVLCESDEFVVEQCTGLKDKNGELIYEGDIVRVTGDCLTIPPYLESKLAKVVWEINCFCFYFPRENESYFSECWDYEIVGNIHENADLLEEKSEKPIF